MSTRRRLRGAVTGIVFGVTPVMILGACATERAVVVEDAPRAAALDTEPWAIDDVQGGAEALTLSLAQEIQRTSGAPVVTKQQVANEMNDCSVEPCPRLIRDLFTSAPVIFVANVASAGRGFLATGSARSGAKVLKRASATGRSADEAVRAVGVQLGEALRAMKVGGQL